VGTGAYGTTPDPESTPVFAYDNSSGQIIAGNNKVKFVLNTVTSGSYRVLDSCYYWDRSGSSSINFLNTQKFYPSITATGNQTFDLKYIDNLRVTQDLKSAEIAIRLINSPTNPTVFGTLYIRAWRDNPWIDYWCNLQNSSAYNLKTLNFVIGGFNKSDQQGYVILPNNGSGQLITFSQMTTNYWNVPITYRIQFGCVKITPGILGIWWPDGHRKLANLYLRFNPANNDVIILTDEEMWVKSGQVHQGMTARLAWYPNGDWMTAAKGYREDRLATFNPTPLWKRAQQTPVIDSMVKSPLNMICEGNTYESRAGNILAIKDTYGIKPQVKLTLWGKYRFNHGDFDYFPVTEWYNDNTALYDWDPAGSIGRQGTVADTAFKNIVTLPMAQAGMPVGVYTIYTTIGYQQQRFNLNTFVAMNETGNPIVNYQQNDSQGNPHVVLYQADPNYVANGDPNQYFYNDIDRMTGEFEMNCIYMDTLGASPRNLDFNPTHGGPPKSARPAYEGVITMAGYIHNKGAAITSEGTPEFLILRNLCDGSLHTVYATTSLDDRVGGGYSIPLMEFLYHDYWLCCRQDWGYQDQYGIRSIMHGGPAYAHSAGMDGDYQWYTNPNSTWGVRTQRRKNLYNFGLSAGLQTAQMIDWKLLAMNPQNSDQIAEICVYKRKDQRGGIVTLGNYRGVGNSQTFVVDIDREKFGIPAQTSCVMRISESSEVIQLPPGQIIHYECILNYPDGRILSITPQ
jgi:hypothetical protein